jgi:hypothetical protein
MEALQYTNAPLTPRKPDNDRMADGTPRLFGCRRTATGSSDEEATSEVPGQQPAQPTGRTCDSEAEQPLERPGPEDPPLQGMVFFFFFFFFFLKSFAGFYPMIGDVLCGPIRTIKCNHIDNNNDNDHN